MGKEYQNKQQIISDIKNGWYSLKKVTEKDENLSREKRRKKLEKKVQKAKKESMKEIMLLFFKLGKKLDEEYN